MRSDDSSKGAPTGLPSRRQLRVGEIVRQTLAMPLARLSMIRGGRVFEVMITVTEVRMSPDLRHANVFVRCYPQQKPPKDWLKQLRLARKSLRTEIGGQLHLKFTPDLHFEEDKSFLQADKIERLIAQDRRREETYPSLDSEDAVHGIVADSTNSTDSRH